MSSYIVYFLFYALSVYANTQNNFIIDYFIHKKVTSIVGFSCSSRKGKKFFIIKYIIFLSYKTLLFLDNFILIKRLSLLGITASIRRLDENHKISHSAFSIYSKVGIFLDLQCYDRDVVDSVFAQVRLFSF